MNQERAESVMPKDFRRLRRMEWLTVSKAALRSRRRRMVREPESKSRRSFVTLISAVSVLWWVLKPDWNVSYRLLERR